MKTKQAIKVIYANIDGHYASWPVLSRALHQTDMSVNLHPPGSHGSVRVFHDGVAVDACVGDSLARFSQLLQTLATGWHRNIKFSWNGNR